MATGRIQEERIQSLNGEEMRDDGYVLYWMQPSQRVDHNHALEYAVGRDNDLDGRLLVVFGLTDVGPIAYNHPRAT